ncbi:MAG: hypothetical protein K6E40_17465 [Desulfovibrio sp.]|nr:hypothetical protein [Desulfovibrio sp.]
MENISVITDSEITDAACVAIAEAEAEVAAAAVAGTEKAPWQWQCVPLKGDPETVEAVTEIFRLRDVRIALHTKLFSVAYSGKSARDASVALRDERAKAEALYAVHNVAMQAQIRDGLQGSMPGDRDALAQHDEALAHLQGLEAAINRYRAIEEQSVHQADVLVAAGLLIDTRIADAVGRAREVQARAKANAG